MTVPLTTGLSRRGRLPKVYVTFVLRSKVSPGRKMSFKESPAFPSRLTPFVQSSDSSLRWWNISLGSERSAKYRHEPSTTALDNIIHAHLQRLNEHQPRG